jgi:hypothetical protein
VPSENIKWKSHKMESSDTKYRGGVARSREEGTVMVLDRRGSPIQSSAVSNRVNGRTDGKMAKSFEITKREVYESYLEVKRNSVLPAKLREICGLRVYSVIAE